MKNYSLNMITNEQLTYKKTNIDNNESNEINNDNNNINYIQFLGSMPTYINY